MILAAFLAVDPWGFDRFGPLRFLLVSTLGFAVVAAGLVGGTDARLPRTVRLGGAALFGGLGLSTITAADRHPGSTLRAPHVGAVRWAVRRGVPANDR